MNNPSPQQIEQGALEVARPEQRDYRYECNAALERAWLKRFGKTPLESLREQEE